PDNTFYIFNSFYLLLLLLMTETSVSLRRICLHCRRSLLFQGGLFCRGSRGSNLTGTSLPGSRQSCSVAGLSEERVDCGVCRAPGVDISCIEWLGTRRGYDQYFLNFPSRICTLENQSI